MALRVSCPKCASLFDFPDSVGGKAVRCPKCSQILKISAPVSPPPPVIAHPDVPEVELTQHASAPVPTGIRAKPPTPAVSPAPFIASALPRAEFDAPRIASRRSDSHLAVIVGACIALGVFMVVGLGVLSYFLLSSPAEVAPPAPPQQVVEVVKNDPRPLPKEAIEKEKDKGLANVPNDKDKRPPVEPNKDKVDAPPPVPQAAKWVLPPANVQPLAIEPAPRTMDRATIKLPGTVAKACLAGGGRFLLLHIPSHRQIAVLDVSERKIVKYIPLAADQALFTAGLEKLVVAYPQTQVWQRWNLITFDKELTVNAPLATPIRALCMGHASHGPILVGLQPEGFAPGGIQFVALDNFKIVDMPVVGKRSRMGDGAYIHASANGRCFAMRHGVGGEPHEVSYLQLTDRGIMATHAGMGGSVLAPSPDGRFVYCSGGVCNADLKLVHGLGAQQAFAKPYIPAAHGSYFLRLDYKNWEKTGGKVLFYLSGNYTHIAQLDNVGGVSAEQISHGHNRDSMTHTERIHFIPNAHLLLSIPQSNDQVELIRFNPLEAMKRAGIDYLLVDSEPVPFAVRGKKYVYPVSILSKKGNAKIKLDSGPEGMKILADMIVWDVPDAFAEPEAGVITTVTDASGQEIFHNFKLAVLDRAPQNALPAPNVQPAKRDPEPDPPLAIRKVEPSPRAIVPPKLEAPTVHELSDVVDEVAVGGAGRFLLYGMPKIKKIALFDANAAKLVHSFTVAEEDFLFTAGMSKLIVVYPAKRVIQRFDLLSRERELTLDLPFKHDAHMALMGNASDGPVLVGAGGYYSRGANGGTLLDLRTLTALDVKCPEFVTGVTRVAGDGSVVTCWQPGISPNPIHSYVFTGREFKQYAQHEVGGHIVPGPDGRHLFTNRGIFTNECKPIAHNKEGHPVLPSVHGDYYLNLNGNGLAVHLMGDTRPLLDIGHIRRDLDSGAPPKKAKPQFPVPTTTRAQYAIGWEKRLHLIPEAKLFVGLGPTRDRIHVYPLDIFDALDKKGIDYLLVTSRPPQPVPGQAYQYAIQVKSKKGGVRYRLESGPEGMKVSVGGILSWAVPAAFDEQRVLLTISDASGQEVFHSFKLVPGASDK